MRLRADATIAIAVAFFAVASPPAFAAPIAPVTAIQATPADVAQAEASSAKARVDALLQKYETASKQVNTGVHALAAAFASGASAELTQDEAAAQERRVLARQRAQIRAVYAGGGPVNMTASVLGASSPDDALWRASTADRVLSGLLSDTRDDVAKRASQASLAHRRALQADAATAAQAQALDSLQLRAAEAETSLADAQQTLSALDSKARQAKAAEESARQIAAAQDAARAARLAAMGPVTALGIPVELEAAYRAAAPSCAGLRWTLLAAVGQVESGHGRNNGPSSAGAIGPMQFMPRTFARYAVDGDRDGVKDARDPEDAIWTAARYLCSSGADGGSATGVHAALLAYNHAEWYVDLVLAAEQAIITQESAE